MQPRVARLLSCVSLALITLSSAFSFRYENVSLSTGVTLSCLFSGASPEVAVGTIIFLHGFPEGSWAWSGIIGTGALDSYALVAPDQRGYNASSQTPGRYDISNISADAEALVRRFADKTGRVHLVAHDWGGAIAWWLTAAHPELLHTLTILNMAHPLGWINEVRHNPVQQAASAYVLFFVNPVSTEIMTANDDANLKHVFDGELWFDSAQEAAYVEAWQVPGSVDASLDWYRENIMPHCPLSCVEPSCFNQGVSCTFDNMPNNGTIQTPTLVLWGMLDTAFDSEGQLAFIPTKVAPSLLNITRFPNNNHSLGQEAPVQVAQAVFEWAGAHQMTY